MIDSMIYSVLAEESHLDPQFERLEKLVTSFLLLPISEVRERIIVKVYQKIRMAQSFTSNDRRHFASNCGLLAKFIYRK